MSITIPDIVNGINAASSQTGVPAGILLGVLGQETSFGTNVTTSSTGAMGAFQFEPATAQQYGYPMTNTLDAKTFNAQALAAGHYLADLSKQTGSWDAALKHYSGGGYGLAQVQKQVKNEPSFLAHTAAGGIDVAGAVGSGVGSVKNAVTAPFNAVSDVASAIGNIASALGNPHTWLTVAKFLGGAILLLLGLRGLLDTGSGSGGSRVAHAARKVAAA